MNPEPPKDQRARSSTFALAYAHVLPGLRQIAWEHGYALAVHGSMVRDLDLIAAPWVEKVKDPAEMVEAMRAAVGGFFREETYSDHNPSVRHHGRLSWAIYLNEQSTAPYIDISVLAASEDVLRAQFEEIGKVRNEVEDANVANCMQASKEKDELRGKLLVAEEDRKDLMYQLDQLYCRVEHILPQLDEEFTTRFSVNEAYLDIVGRMSQIKGLLYRVRSSIDGG